MTATSTAMSRLSRFSAGLNLGRLTKLQRNLFHAGYDCGLTDGITIGRRLAEQEMAAAWALATQRVRAARREPTHDDLVQRRTRPAPPLPTPQQCHASWDIPRQKTA